MMSLRSVLIDSNVADSLNTKAQHFDYVIVENYAGCEDSISKLFILFTGEMSWPCYTYMAQ